MSPPLSRYRALIPSTLSIPVNIPPHIHLLHILPPIQCHWHGGCALRRHAAIIGRATRPVETPASAARGVGGRGGGGGEALLLVGVFACCAIVVGGVGGWEEGGVFVAFAEVDEHAFEEVEEAVFGEGFREDVVHSCGGG